MENPKMTELPQATGSDEEWTCGKGLAAHARIPAKIAEFLESLADNLDAHVPTIDMSDSSGHAERAAYVRLSKEYRVLAAQLAGTAKHMDEYRDLPVARHYEEELAHPRLLEAFRRFVALETELAELLAASAEQDRQLLEESLPADETS
jgi:hypothetical protein